MSGSPVAVAIRVATTPGAASACGTSVSAPNAQIAVGKLNILDDASGRSYALEGIDGELTIRALGGPFGFQGGGSIGDQHYSFHLTTAAFDAAGNTQLSLFAQPDGNGFSVNIGGTLATSGMPHFVGDFSYRQSPPAARNGNGVIGDLTGFAAGVLKW